MKLKIAVATIAGCAALAACGGNKAEDNVANYDANMDMNAGMTDLNAGTEMNAGADMNAGMDMNATNDMNASGNATDNTVYNSTETNTTNSL